MSWLDRAFIWCFSVDLDRLSLCGNGDTMGFRNRRGVVSVTSSPGGQATEFLGFSGCSVANAGSEAEPSSAAGRLAFICLSARVRVSRGWQTIWETSGGRTSRQPPEAQVSARSPPTFLLPWSILASAALPACSSRGGLPGGGAWSRGSTRRRWDWRGTTSCHT